MKRLISLAALITSSCLAAHAADSTPDQDEQIKLKSKTWMALTMKADGLIKAHKYAEAEAVYKQIIADREPLGRDSVSEYDALGALYLKWGKTNEAVEAFKNSVDSREKLDGKDDPTLVPLLRQYADVLTKAGKKSEASQVTTRANAIEKFADGPDLFPKIAGAVGSPERIAEGEKFRSLGEKYMLFDRQQKAAKYFNQAALLNPDDALAICGRAEAECFAEQNARALADFDRAIKLKPDLARAYVGRAHLHESMNNNKLALADLDKARAIDPKDASSMGDRAKLLDTMGKHQAAVDAYSEIITNHPDLYWPYVQRSVALTSLEKFKEAADDLTVLVKRAPEDSDFYEYRAAVYSKSGDFQAAVADYSKVIELSPQYSIGYHERAKLFEKLDGKKTQRVLADYAKAKKLGYQ